MIEEELTWSNDEFICTVRESSKKRNRKQITSLIFDQNKFHNDFEATTEFFGIIRSYMTIALSILTKKMGISLNKLDLEGSILNKRKKED